MNVSNFKKAVFWAFELLQWIMAISPPSLIMHVDSVVREPKIGHMRSRCTGTRDECLPTGGNCFSFPHSLGGAPLFLSPPSERLLLEVCVASSLITSSLKYVTIS